MMNECIICRKQTTDFSDEHVIPDSLGGYYHIHSVCGTCNSTFGNRVDGKLVNHKFAEFLRVCEGIQGKSGRIPNPFSGTHVFENNPEQKVQVRIEDDGKMTFFLVPLVKNGTIVADARDQDLSKIENTKAERMAKQKGVPLDKIKISRQQGCIEDATIGIKWSIPVEEFEIGFLKIAYEFAVDKIPAYYSDPKAIEISKILYEAVYNQVANFVRMGDEVQHSIKMFEEMMSEEMNFDSKHYLILIRSDAGAGLLCFINLCGFPAAVVVLSDKSNYIPANILKLGINDIRNKCFQVFDVPMLSDN